MSPMKACCESIARSGFGILQIPDAMLQDYKKIIDGYSAIPRPSRMSFPLPRTRMVFSLLAPSTPLPRITRTCASGFVTGPRTLQKEPLSNSPEVLSLSQSAVLNDR
ncbi:hypothetical protein [Pseudomonas sp. KT_2_4]|uniref:hypothetical protein n=1 Tax=Pseudomonas TaxID=286 RepID=UPI0021802302|nr:hypothetical protein [Pseudomonas azotoformans]